MKTSREAKSGGLPARWRRNRLIAGLVSFLMAMAVLYPLSPFGHADRLDAWWLRIRFFLRDNRYDIHARSWRQIPPKVDPDIAIIEIDEYSVGQNEDKTAWHMPAIAWNPYIAKTLDILRVSGAKAVGIDRIQPETTAQWLKAPRINEPDNDEILLSSISKANNIVWAKEFREGHWVQPWDGLLSVIPEGDWANIDNHVGFANLHRNGESVTAFEPVLANQPDEVSLAARVAERGNGVQSRIVKGWWELPGHARIRLREDNSALIDYAPGIANPEPGPWPITIVSMRKLVSQPVEPDNRFRNKLVLIGTSFEGDPDKHPVPMFGPNGFPLVPGVRIQAAILQSMIHGRTLGEPREWQIWLLSCFLGVCGVVPFLMLRWLWAALSIAGTAILWTAISAILFAAAHFALPVSLPIIGLALCGTLMGSYLSLSEERERRKVMGLWGQYQDPRLVDFLLKNETARGGQGREMEVTVLFADLKNFTKTVEHLSPTQTIVALNRYLGMLNTVIRAHGGIVDKYLGDGLMAQWGAPEVSGEPGPIGHAEAALRACLEIQARARDLENEELSNPGSVGFELRLTLHTGPVVFGWVGAQRLELTIIGDTVNVTARLQETAKQLNSDFLISESTYSELTSDVTIGNRAEMEIRGRDRPLQVYEILGVSS